MGTSPGMSTRRHGLLSETQLAAPPNSQEQKGCPEGLPSLPMLPECLERFPNQDNVTLENGFRFEANATVLWDPF